MAAGVATNPQHQNMIANAANDAQGILGNPVGTNVTPQPVTAQAVNNDLSQYMNPYQDSVVDATLAQLNQF